MNNYFAEFLQIAMDGEQNRHSRNRVNCVYIDLCSAFNNYADHHQMCPVHRVLQGAYVMNILSTS